MQPAGKLSRFIAAPENRAAWMAIEEVVATFHGEAARRVTSPIFIHGPGGTGKTHLATALVHELCRQHGTLVIQQLAANEWKLLLPPPRQFTNPSLIAETPNHEAEPVWIDQARQADLLVIEDVQHLPRRAAEGLANLLDARLARRMPTLVTSRFGPRHLPLPARLTSRLAAGLVVGLEPLQAPSRLLLLQEFVQRRQLALDPEILRWLAAHLTGGGRQLEGAVAQLATLSQLQRKPLKFADVRPHFRAQIDALRPSVERIVQHVGGHFHVETNELLSRRRLRAILVPRQIGMYLARHLTQLSFKQIGASFGGHDHTTVLHACRKIEGAIQHDALLSGTVRQLQAELA
jgi:chromosomal replication initiator protein